MKESPKDKDIIIKEKREKSEKISKKEKLYDPLNQYQKVKDWIDLKLFIENDFNSEDQKNADKNNQNNELDLNSFIHEFKFDEDILRRRDWQKKPDSLIGRITQFEFDFKSNNAPIKDFIVKDKDDPFYYNSNPFTLEIVPTEEEKLTNLLKKYNLPDLNKYIDDQQTKNDEEKKKSISSLNNLKRF